MTTQQVETATIIGSCTGNGNATITVTSARISTNPTAVSVAVTTADNTASLVADKCRTALALNSVISDVFQVSGAGANIVLTERVARANDTTLNIASANGTCTGLTAAPTSTNTTAGDGLDNAYITLADIKANGALGMTDTTNDAELEAAINATSRAIDNLCNRYFYKNTADETRYFTPTYTDECYVGDLLSITNVHIDTNLDRTYSDALVAGTDYDLYPYNNGAGLITEPYWRLDRIRNSTFSFAKGEPKYIKIVGVWGWPAIPSAVSQACLLWSMRTWERHKTILGVSSVTALGQMRVQVPPPDPDVLQLLSNYQQVITGVI